MIGRNGERGSGMSALAARRDDDDDIFIKKYYDHSLSMPIPSFLHHGFIIHHGYITDTHLQTIFFYLENSENFCTHQII